MSYKELQLRQLIKNHYVPKEQLPHLFQTQQKELIKENKGLLKTKQAYQQKVSDLETSLLNLAKQKIKGQKEAEGLIKQLETNWEQEKQELKAQITHLENTDTNQKITNLENNLADTKGELIKVKNQVKSLLKTKKKLEDQLESANSQLDGLFSALNKGLIDNKNWKEKVLNYSNVIKNLLKN